MINIKRVYEKPDKNDGQRILVDRLWPRGLSKARAKVDLWLKEIAPSNELRVWFGKDPEKWGKFKTRYYRELDRNPAFRETLLAQIRKGKVTLLYAKRDCDHNNAAALKEYVIRWLGDKFIDAVKWR